jgi:hypothetical protein
MWAATTIDESTHPLEGRGWSVVGNLISQNKSRSRFVPQERVIAFAFMPPESPMFEKLSKYGDSWDFRTGETWDVFFPGYYVSWDKGTEDRSSAQALGSDFTQAWYFDRESYHLFVSQVEQNCKDAGRIWSWSGSSTLLFLRATVGADNVTFDWRHYAQLELHQLSSNASYEAENRLIEKISKTLETDPENPLVRAYEVIQDETATPLTFQGGFSLTGAVAGIMALFFP